MFIKINFLNEHHLAVTGILWHAPVLGMISIGAGDHCVLLSNNFATFNNIVGTQENLSVTQVLSLEFPLFSLLNA